MESGREQEDSGLRILGASWTNRHREMGNGAQPNMPNQYRSSTQPGGNPGLAFREVCRSVLNLNTLMFVAANAPSEVVSSFEVHQQRLASFSLQEASKMLVRQLTESRSRPVQWLVFTAFSVFHIESEECLLAGCLYIRAPEPRCPTSPGARDSAASATLRVGQHSEECWESVD